MGVVPLTFEDGTSWETLGLRGDERVSLADLANIKPRQKMVLHVTSAGGVSISVPVLCRIDTLDELEYFRNGGILHYVLRNLAAAA